MLVHFSCTKKYFIINCSLPFPPSLSQNYIFLGHRRQWFFTQLAQQCILGSQRKASFCFSFWSSLKCCLGMVLEKSNRSKVTTKIRRVIRVKSELSCWTAICMRVEILFRCVLPILLSFSVSSLYSSWFLAYHFASSAEEEGVWLPCTFIAYVCIFLGGKLLLHYKDKH